MDMGTHLDMKGVTDLGVKYTTLVVVGDGAVFVSAVAARLPGLLCSPWARSLSIKGT